MGEIHSITNVNPERFCVFCHEPIFLLEGVTRKKNIKPEHLKEGLIYSPEGVREFRISGICEFCFDKISEEE